MKTALDRILEGFSIDDKGIKAEFKIEGEEFWIVKTKGLFRLQTVARSLMDVCELDRTSVIAGLYDHLIAQLAAMTFHKSKDHPEGVCLSDYDAVLSEIGKDDQMKAINIHQDLPYGMALACLGKSLLARMMPALVTSTLPTSKVGSEGDSNQDPDQAESQKTSSEHAQGFRVEVPTTGTLPS